ncbi:hypothetical protein [Ruegeria halocynthiae]|uniref:hypothetical protein n=1 Tax=Ruegeria halocynthiae TaxID=985054 RepID=UPI00056718C5|nr:hypothetical protein [Ruegeria halocynthiae]
MVAKPPERYWTKAAIDYLAERLGVQNEPWMQDWAYEIADPTNLNDYLALFSEVQDDDVRFTLADVIIQAFEEYGENLEGDDRWNAFLDDLATRPELHAHQIWYWSAFDIDIEDAWQVTPYMRSQYHRFG